MKTAFTYDPFNLKHTLSGHPENYRRLQGTWSLLQSDGILTRLQQVESCPAEREALLAVHSDRYVERVQEMSRRGGGHLDPDTYVNGDSYEAALRAAGGLLNVVDVVLDGSADNGLALVRPPGHHARPQQGMGFCLFGNIAIAARHAQRQHGLQRVLIADFDVHHGNGTQEMFYDDPDVLFFSVHQYPYYPGSGALDETGSGPGTGATVNVPFASGVGDNGYVQAFREILSPIARRFEPELILLSAGYDAHWMDPLAGHQVSISGYVQMVEILLALADDLCSGRLVCTLEGGYNLDVLPHCVLTSLRTLSGAEAGPSDPFGTTPRQEPHVSTLLQTIKSIHNLTE